MDTKDTRDGFIKKPIYPGGPKEMTKFIYQNLKYPQKAIESKVQGTVYVNFDIDYRGKVIDAKILKSVGHGCDAEAIRIVKLLEFEIPKNPRKLKLVFHKKVKIKFTLPKPKKVKKAPQQSQQSMQYVITSTTKSAKKSASQKPKSYSYSIKY